MGEDRAAQPSHETLATPLKEALGKGHAVIVPRRSFLGGQAISDGDGMGLASID
jgi:hypothetical protein